MAIGQVVLTANCMCCSLLVGNEQPENSPNRVPTVYHCFKLFDFDGPVAKLGRDSSFVVAFALLA